MALDIGDRNSVLFRGLSGFWQKFFKDAQDIEAYYQASEIYLGQAYLDLLGSILNIGIVDTPIFNKEVWKLFTIDETELDFVAGEATSEDRFYYDMPGEIVDASFLQNTIFNPEIVLEKDVNFEVLDNDGYIRFKDDPFRYATDDNGIWGPQPGVAWRTVRKEVGNRFIDRSTRMYTTAPTDELYDSGVRRGDSLRLLGYHGTTTASGLVGSIVTIPTGFQFTGTGVGANCKIGDVLYLYGHSGAAGHADDTLRGYYTVNNILNTNQVELDAISRTGTRPTASTTNLYWRRLRGIYFDTPRDHEVDYLNNAYGVGNPDSAYPLDKDVPYIFSVIRTPGDPTVTGVALTWTGGTGGLLPSPLITNLGQRHLTPGTVVVIARKCGYTGAHTGASGATVLTDGSAPWVANDLVGREVSNTTDGSSGRVTSNTTTTVTVELAGGTNNYWDLGDTYTIATGASVEEGVDFSVDYLRGYVYQTRFWDPSSNGRCSYEFSDEVYFSAAADIQEYSVGNVRQLSYWVPDVLVDRFNLWYNYGSLLNRFEASSAAYKAFLRGIMYLYMTGPILERIESALNVAAEYPVVDTAGEVLTAYDNGQDAGGIDATIDGTNDTVTVPTSEHIFTELDVGGYIIFPSPLSAANAGRFVINSVDSTTNAVTVEAQYGLATETGSDWILSRMYTKVVTTTRREYTYPYYVPIREDIQEPSSINSLTFSIFEPLTLAFTVTDYLEDNTWWHDTDIPQSIWPLEQTEIAGDTAVTPRQRRKAVTTLIEHVVGADDGACIGDPGLFVGADESGIVMTPDNTPNPGVPPVIADVNLSRHTAAFVIFDQYLKMQMFSISIDPALELDDEFKDDLNDLVLVAKPSYTYPAVELNDGYYDPVTLTDVFGFSGFDFVFGGDEDGRLDGLVLAENELKVGDEDFPWYVGDFFRYRSSVSFTTGALVDPLTPGASFIVPGIPSGAGMTQLNLDCTRTSDGAQAIEGRDYTVDWLAEYPAGTPSVSAWRVTFLTECSAGSSAPNVTGTVWYTERLNGVYDTTQGWTPVCVGGLNPWYVRAGALSPSDPDYAVQWAALRTEHIDRPVQLTVVEGGGSYTYP